MQLHCLHLDEMPKEKKEKKKIIIHSHSTAQNIDTKIDQALERQLTTGPNYGPITHIS